MSNDSLAGNVMEEIDFLPEQFRRQHVERQFQPWRILAVCVAAALVIGAAATQSKPSLSKASLRPCKPGSSSTGRPPSLSPT